MWPPEPARITEPPSKERIAITSAPNFVPKFGWRWLRLRCVALLLGMTKNNCHCEEAQRADAAIRTPVPSVGADAHIGPPFALLTSTPQGGVTMTDAPNSGTEFGWRKPHPRRTPPPTSLPVFA